LTNQNPDILAMLAADPWHTSGRVVVYSTSPGGYGANTTSSTFTSPSEFIFEMLVEAAAGGTNGVVYNVWAERGNTYFWPTLTGVVVRPLNFQPYPTEVELRSGVGVVQIKLGGDENCQTPPNATSISVGSLSTFDYGGYLTGYVREGSSSQTNIYYTVQTADGPVQTWVSAHWNNVQCDQVVRICKQALPPAPISRGDIRGPFEVVGEAMSWGRFLYAYNGPNGSSGSHGMQSQTPEGPVRDPSRWWQISRLQEGTYNMYAYGGLRLGRAYNYFTTPHLAGWAPGGRVTVAPNQTMVLSRVINGESRYPFVMKPSYFYGSVRLADPSVPQNPGSISTLQTLYFDADYDSNGDGVPNDPWLNMTRLYAHALSGYTLTSFPGSFDAATGELASNYEQVLPHTYDLPYTWTHESLRLVFWSEGTSSVGYTRPGLYDPARFRYGSLYLIPSAGSSQEMVPLQRHRIDHEYCFNEVDLFVRTDLGRFYNPWVDVNGNYIGTDWRSQQVRYIASGTFYGSPYVYGYSSPQNYAQTTGMLYMALPQGSYTLRPGANMVSDSGSVSPATFAPIQMALGCGQRVRLVPPLAVVINPVDRCARGSAVPVTGVVRSSPALVDRIWYRINNGPEQVYCTNCGMDPTFSFTAQLASCENTIQVYAQSYGMPAPATGSQQVVWDDPADGPSCPGSYCLNRPPVARCRNVTVPADEWCTGGCGSVDDGSYDPDVGDSLSCVQTPGCPYAMGTNQVTLTCTDSAGHSSACQATVTVRDMAPPTIACPSESVLECSGGGAQATYTPTASDNCGSVITACTPASGSTFGLGTTATTCTAFDQAGNRASCTFGVTVQDSQPPEMACPADVTAECTGNGGATVELAGATATDACGLSGVQGPTGTSFPVGTTGVSYTATDVTGHQAVCTTNVTVTDTQPPTLALQGDAAMTLVCGIDTYTEPGATATDVCVGDLSAQVQVSGSVNPYQPGSYTLTYTVVDGVGQSAAATRTVEVVEGPNGCCRPNAGHFTPTGHLALDRILQAAVRLLDGRVLVVGGYSKSTEVYEPATGLWAPGATARTYHRYHTATLLADGRVLVAGGDGSSSTTSAEVYDSGTNTWAYTGNLLTHRRAHGAALLPDGKVLVMGGSNGSTVLASAEVYDPGTGTWAATGSMAQARRSFTTTVLADGRVLVAGGVTDASSDSCNDSGTNCLASAEVYDPATGTWSPAGSMGMKRGFHAAALLGGGQVLVAGGGANGAQSAGAEVYDPVANAWTATGSMGSPRRHATLTRLGDGRVLALGGYDATTGILTTAELYDPATGRWCPTGSTGQDRYKHTATLLEDGRILVTTGISNTDQGSAEVYAL
jgi:hypothetical protein